MLFHSQQPPITSLCHLAAAPPPPSLHLLSPSRSLLAPPRREYSLACVLHLPATTMLPCSTITY
jgi:hypothetical protein